VNRPNRGVGGPEVTADGFPAEARFRFDPPERSAQQADADNLRLLSGVQDVVHGAELPPWGGLRQRSLS